MSRHTSLQRTEHQSPECHQQFSVVKITLPAGVKLDGKSKLKKNRSTAETLPPCPKQNLKIRVD